MGRMQSPGVSAIVTAIWGIRNDHPELGLLKYRFVSVSWDEIGDANRYAPDREALRVALAQPLPGDRWRASTAHTVRRVAAWRATPGEEALAAGFGVGRSLYGAGGAPATRGRRSPRMSCLAVGGSSSVG